MPDDWTKVAKPTGGTWTRVGKGGVDTFDDSAITYDSSTVQYDGNN